MGSSGYLKFKLGAAHVDPKEDLSSITKMSLTNSIIILLGKNEIFSIFIAHLNCLLYKGDQNW